MRVVRYDFDELPQTAETTPEGFLRADSVLSRTGIFQYQNPDGSPRRELRHPEDVFHADSLASFRLLPVTNDHPPAREADGLRLVDASNARSLGIGFTGENVRADGEHVRAPIVITDAQGVAAVKAGRRYLSAGYTARLDAEPGVYQGQQYDVRQREIRGNHVSIVDRPRAGDVAQIRLDSAGNQMTEGEVVMETKKLATVVLDGIGYEAAPEVANALSRARTDAEGFKTRLDESEKKHKEDLDRLRADRDVLKERLDKAEKRDVKAEIASGVIARLALVDVARRILPAETKLDAMSDAEIRKAVILAKSPDLKLEDKSEAYLQARFDAAVEGVADDAKRTDALGEQRRLMTSRQDAASPNSIDEAMKRNEERISKQWRPAAA